MIQLVGINKDGSWFRHQFGSVTESELDLESVEKVYIEAIKAGVYKMQLEFRPDFNGDIQSVSHDIVEKMLHYQKAQTGIRNIAVFEASRFATRYMGGFNWDDTDEGFDYWKKILE